jgi:hypothetical protein
MRRPSTRLTQADIARALRAAAQSGTRVVVEIDPVRGLIRITQADQPASAPVELPREIVL